MAKRKANFYAVARGQQPGIYTEWFGGDGAEAQVKGFPGARYEGFRTRQEAEAWLFEQTGVRFSESATVSALSQAANASTTVEHLVIVYTDGGCITNPGPGGYGVVILGGKHRRELSGGFRRTTNNRMELMAAIVGLRALKSRSAVTLYSDSRYVVGGITKGWAQYARAHGWKRQDRQPLLNPDLWEQLLDLCERHTVTFEWVRGHAGNPENERCDQLAMQAAQQKNLPPDDGYEAAESLKRAQLALTL